MLDAIVAPSIEEIGRDDWNACFHGQIESYDYLHAVERSGLPDFDWRYVALAQRGRLLAAAPAFFTRYALETTLTGRSRRFVRAARHVFPGALNVALGCIGSPCTETVTLGFAPDVAGSAKPVLVRRLVGAFERHALDSGRGLLAIKDVPETDRGLWRQATEPLGYRAVPGLPVASLDIDFATVDDYLARLSPATRKDMRRKLRSASAIRIELTNDLTPVLDRMIALYRATRGRAAMQFEELTAEYFVRVAEGAPEDSVCVMYFKDDDLLAANLLLRGGKTLLDKFFCMDGDQGRRYNLYFLSWFTNIKLCLAWGLSRYQSGQAAYENKLRLGSRLTATEMYFRHRNLAVHGVLGLVAPIFTRELPMRRGVA